MKRTNAIGLLLALAAVGCAPVTATTKVAGPRADAGQAAATLKQPKVEFQEFTLKNGLKVLIVEQHHAPVYTLAVTYDVGSRDEVPGRTGFAHLFEHMMFQGSENVGKAEHFVLIANYGGIMNGSTSLERTNYFEELPSNQLELALFLEADRMRSLDVSQENLDNQRNAVQEERRLRYDNRPYGTVFERLFRLTYDNFAYKHPSIGSMEDLNAATLEDVKSFFKRYYAPNNAVITLVGDVNPTQAMALIEKHFGDIPAQPEPPVVNSDETLFKGERRQTVEDALAPLPRLDIVYPTVSGTAEDIYALDLLSNILGGGESSRLYQALVKDRQLATDTGTFVWQLRGPSPVWTYAMGAPGKSMDEVQKVVDQEIERVQKEPVSEDELARAKTTIRAQLVSTLETSLRTAVELGQHAVIFNNPNLINEQSAHYQAVTAADLQRVAAKYLQPSNRGVLITVPGAKTQPGAPAGGSGTKQ